jgi:hypothetical protein
VFTTIRQYTCDPTDVPEIAHLVDELFADEVAGRDGFVAYELIDCGTGDLFTITVFTDREAARRTSDMAAEFVRERLEEFDLQRVANHTGEVLVNRAQSGMLELVHA